MSLQTCYESYHHYAYLSANPILYPCTTLIFPSLTLCRLLAWCIRGIPQTWYECYHSLIRTCQLCIVLPLYTPHRNLPIPLRLRQRHRCSSLEVSADCVVCRIYHTQYYMLTGRNVGGSTLRMSTKVCNVRLLIGLQHCEKFLTIL